MPKRTNEEKLKYYNNKIQKLLEKQGETVPENVESQGIEHTHYENFWDESFTPALPEPSIPRTLSGSVRHEHLTEETQVDESNAISQIQAPAGEENSTNVLSLDPEILEALGESTDSGPVFGQEIHQNLCNLWQPLLRKGLSKDSKEKILKDYLVPSNCTLLQAPKLNIEISAAVNEVTRLRDKKVEVAQQQLAAGITAVSRALSSILNATNADTSNKIEVIKSLSDGCRILCDLHHVETQSRIKMLTPGLAKPFLVVVQGCERDETLFGADLSEKIKASKTIEKQGMQIKKTVPTSKPAVNYAQNRSQFQGNWAGPSRYQQNRGGRGVQRRLPSSAAVVPRRTQSTSNMNHTNKPTQNRARAPTRQ